MGISKQILLSFIIMAFFSCGKYEKIESKWKPSPMTSQVFSVALSLDDIEIPKLREGIQNIEDIGGIFNDLFGDLGAEYLKDELKNNDEIALVNFLEQEMPSLERLDLDQTIEDVELDYLEIYIDKDNDLTNENNLNFIKSLRLEIAAQRVIKNDAQIQDEKDFKDLESLEVVSYNQAESESTYSEYNQDSDKCEIRNIDNEKLISQSEPLIENDTESLCSIMAIGDFSKLKDPTNQTKVALNDKKHLFEYIDGQFLKYSIKFKINKVKWIDLIKRNNKFHLSLFVKSNSLPPMAFKKIGLKFHIKIKAKI